MLASGIPVMAGALEVAGIQLDETIRLDSGPRLVLNGAGIRKKVFFNIYVGALYLEEKSTDADNILNSGKSNRVLMHFIYDGVSKKKITDGWNSGFEKNLSPETLATLRPRINEFNAMFTDTRAGDRIFLDYVPDKGTLVTINDTQKGIVAGSDFNRALLGIWLGEKPVTSSLKNALLGKN